MAGMQVRSSSEGVAIPSRKATPQAEWHRAIDESDLTAPCRTVLRQLLAHDQRQSGIVYPSVSRLVKTTGLSERTVRRCLDKLDDRGWIARLPLATPYSVRNYRLIPPGDSERVGGVTVREGRVSQCEGEGVTVRGGGCHSARGEGVTVRDEHPSMKNRLKNRMNMAHEPDGSRGVAEMDGCQDARTMLANAGVRGRNLERLAADPRITPDVVREAWTSILSDPKVRNRAGVLVKTLAERFGIDTASRYGRQLSASEGKAADTLSQLRRQHGSARQDPTRITLRTRIP
jgi:hypothetical protein